MKLPTTMVRRAALTGYFLALAVGTGTALWVIFTCEGDSSSWSCLLQASPAQNLTMLAALALLVIAVVLGRLAQSSEDTRWLKDVEALKHEENE